MVVCLWCVWLFDGLLRANVGRFVCIGSSVMGECGYW